MKRSIFQMLLFSSSLALFHLPLGVCTAAEDDTRAVGAVVVQEPRQPSTYALLIGIDDYQGNARNLKCAVKDTLGLAETLKNIGVPEDRIRVVSDKSSVKPSAQNIRRQVELICKIVTEDDNLLISFSCHGVEDEKDQSEAYFCPNDLNRKDINTFISRRWVEKEIEKSKARKKVLIADCCREKFPIPQEARSMLGVKNLGNPLGDKDSRGFAKLVSCGNGEFSYESEYGYGVFTYFIMEGLKGNADTDRDGKIGFDELYKYVRDKTRDYVFKKENDAQLPEKGGQYGGEFVLANVKPRNTFSPNTLKAGDRKVITIKGVDYAFHWCPPGTFMMGSPESEEYRNENIETQHQVTLTKGFLMGETEVTVGQFRAFVNATGYRTEAEKGDGSLGMKDGKLGRYADINWNNSGFSQNDNQPLIHVSWNDAKAYVDWLNTLAAELVPSGYKFALPTEAQWEYACRAGTTGKYAGDLDSMAWYGETYGSTHPVGTKRANAWGLYDMHGNVWEWCSDWYDWSVDYNGSATDPTGASSGSNRVDRGGSWDDFARDCRSAFRNWVTPDSRTITSASACPLFSSNRHG